MSTNSNADTIEHFGLVEARQLIPEGRRPYVQVREALKARWRNDAAQALGSVILAHERGVLTPPLSEELAIGIKNAYDAIGDSALSNDERGEIARIAIDAVYEHGYGRD